MRNLKYFAWLFLITSMGIGVCIDTGLFGYRDLQTPIITSVISFLIGISILILINKDTK